MLNNRTIVSCSLLTEQNINKQNVDNQFQASEYKKKKLGTPKTLVMGISKVNNKAEGWCVTTFIQTLHV